MGVLNNAFEDLNRHWMATKKRVKQELEVFFLKNPGNVIELLEYVLDFSVQVQYIGTDIHGLWFKRNIHDENLYRSEHINPILLAKISIELSKGKYNIIGMPEEGIYRLKAGKDKNGDPIYVSCRMGDYPDTDEDKKMQYELCSRIKRFGLKSPGPRVRTHKFTCKLKEPIKVRYVVSPNNYHEDVFGELTVTTKRDSMAMNTMTMYSYASGVLEHIDCVLINTDDFKKLIDMVK